MSWGDFVQRKANADERRGDTERCTSLSRWNLLVDGDHARVPSALWLEVHECLIAYACKAGMPRGEACDLAHDTIVCFLSRASEAAKSGRPFHPEHGVAEFLFTVERHLVLRRRERATCAKKHAEAIDRMASLRSRDAAESTEPGDSIALHRCIGMLLDLPDGDRLVKSVVDKLRTEARSSAQREPGSTSRSTYRLRERAMRALRGWADRQEHRAT